jgi:hypothetical protein
MAKNKSMIVYRMKTDEQLKTAIRAIIDQLACHGRAISNNGTASRVLSRFLRDPIKQQQIIFRKNIIMLPPGFNLVRVSDNKIKIVVEKEFGEKK